MSSELAPQTESAVHPFEERWARRFFVNVLWSWMGVAASFFTGFFLSPYIIRKLGDHRYGIWALAFAFIDSFMLFDFGFKSAVVNLVSRARAEHDDERINELVNTSLFYFIGISAMLLAVTWGFSGYLDRFFKITPEYRHDFVRLIRIIALAWASALAFGVFNAGMEAFQQFRVQNSISTATLIFRSGGCAIALFLGRGLTTMGLIVLLAQVMTFTLFFLSFRRAFPALRISRHLVRKKRWKEMAQYGIHAFVAYLGNMMLGQGPPILVGHFRAESFVGYYTLPSRLLQALVDLVTRIGFVTMPTTAHLAGRGENFKIVQLGTYLNRYCFALFAPVSVFLLVFGTSLIRVWVGPVYVAQSGPLLIPFVLMTTFAVAGQFNSSQILFGLAKHDVYARALVVEAVLMLATMSVVLPRYGILGAAWVAATFAILNRGLVTPFLLSRILEFPVAAYLRDIFLIPALWIAPEFLYAAWLKSQWPAPNWIHLILILALLVAPFYVACFFTVVEKGHRKTLETLVRGRLFADSRGGMRNYGKG